MSTVNIFNLATGAPVVYTGLSPKEALIAADQQHRGNFSSWTYPSSDQVHFWETDLTIGLEDVCYVKPEASDPAVARRALALRDHLLGQAKDALQDYCARTDEGEGLNDALADKIQSQIFRC